MLLLAWICIVFGWILAGVSGAVAMARFPGRPVAVRAVAWRGADGRVYWRSFLPFLIGFISAAFGGTELQNSHGYGGSALFLAFLPMLAALPASVLVHNFLLTRRGARPRPTDGPPAPRPR